MRDPARVGAPPAPRAGKPSRRRCSRATSRRRSSCCCAGSTRTPTTITPSASSRRGRRGLRRRGRPPTRACAVLREVIGELGLPAGSYVPRNGSGLGHANRITADAMAELLRALYLDPRVGPELMQSLSVGGIDGTTRNRFKGTLAARRVRAKTGTLAGKSCLSGLVGDGPDVLAFSILVQGLRGRHSLGAVRGAQVSCVNAMMRYVREAHGEPGRARRGEPPAIDVEAGEEVSATEGEATEAETPTADDPVDALLRQEQKERAAREASATPGTAGNGGAGTNASTDGASIPKTSPTTAAPKATPTTAAPKVTPTTATMPSKAAPASTPPPPKR